MAKSFVFKNPKVTQEIWSHRHAEGFRHCRGRGVVDSGEYEPITASNNFPLRLKSLEKPDDIPIIRPDIKTLFEVGLLQSKQFQLIGVGLRAAQSGGSLNQFPRRACLLASR